MREVRAEQLKKRKAEEERAKSIEQGMNEKLEIDLTFELCANIIIIKYSTFFPYRHTTKAKQVLFAQLARASEAQEGEKW
ncbi:hypothetical protein FOCC_FOCC009278 [Frankliniella occidentalis]|nr:hypothetical protein FOCC_FOCC009278 [Frankliniella occidentalis]